MAVCLRGSQLNFLLQSVERNRYFKLLMRLLLRRHLKEVLDELSPKSTQLSLDDKWDLITVSDTHTSRHCRHLKLGEIDLTL